ncbi:MAG: DUF4254 domain-containing protein [Desulfovibrionaceae bacterium]
MDALKKTLNTCFAAQLDTVAAWHEQEPDDVEAPQGHTLDALLPLVLRQHVRNFKLWHVEDTARRTDVGHEVIADCKRRIDGLNQSRNDAIERVDACIVTLVTPLLPPLAPDAAPRFNTETIGNALDRLSILSLKLFHMREQTERADVDAAHADSCRAKLDVLREQHRDLCRAVLELVDDYAAGAKRPKVYYQFKMYNDPSLNPELYKHAR